MKLNRELSQKLAKRVDAEDKQCFLNSIYALSAIGEDSAVYVEGYVVNHKFSLVAEHGWLEFKGEIVDATPCYHTEDRDDTRTYFPVRRYTRDDVMKRLRSRKKVSLPLAGNIWLREEDFRRAYREAEKTAYGEETARWLHEQRAQLSG